MLEIFDKKTLKLISKVGADYVDKNMTGEEILYWSIVLGVLTHGKMDTDDDHKAMTEVIAKCDSDMASGVMHSAWKKMTKNEKKAAKGFVKLSYPMFIAFMETYKYNEELESQGIDPDNPGDLCWAGFDTEADCHLCSHNGECDYGRDMLDH